MYSFFLLLINVHLLSFIDWCTIFFFYWQKYLCYFSTFYWLMYPSYWLMILFCLSLNNVTVLFLFLIFLSVINAPDLFFIDLIVLSPPPTYSPDLAPNRLLTFFGRCRMLWCGIHLSNNTHFQEDSDKLFASKPCWFHSKCIEDLPIESYFLISFQANSFSHSLSRFYYIFLFYFPSFTQIWFSQVKVSMKLKTISCK